MKVTLNLTPEEVMQLIKDALASRGHDVSEVNFKIDRGFPGSIDPRENTCPTFAGCDVTAIKAT